MVIGIESIIPELIENEQKILKRELQKLDRQLRFERRILLTMFNLRGYAYASALIAASANGHWSKTSAYMRRKAFEEIGWPKK